ncbi:MAG: alanine racemase [Bacillota bacterium]|nr:MAG: alanine racemase [Bacillota bacterium]
MSEPLRWVEIDHGALAHNVRALRQLLDGAQLWAVVKAQAYGHGPGGTARAVLAAGAAGLIVAVVDEAVELRTAGVKGPILVLTPPLPDQALAYDTFDLIGTVADYETARVLAAAGERRGRPIPVHLKVDTGMGRLGVLPGDAVALATAVHGLAGVELAGVFTHMAAADEEDLSSARAQLERFNAVLAALERHGLRPPMAHAANSAGAIVLPESRYSLARVGIALYGIAPSSFVAARAKALGLELRPALAFRARVVAARRLPAGWPISYGSTYATRTETTVATLPVGYADGLSRSLSHKMHVLVHGQKRPIVGRICMNHCMVDAGDLPVRPGDVVTLLGADGGETITAEDWAQALGTIPYEIVCMVGSRNPRRHLLGTAAAAAS